ncbi:MAG: hypothetical protein AVDCRST_MAG68-3421 [uncultured Gemmatimonadetes bacterium]|uniref:Uncharacterized protein n=1 Tax=uncultured Gemmatimonadota bacterium TaxID=203437 RepID=A0A6J4LP60_9BACT|nr:MAG: hypothetical protein AVDCRST_MAG68-3421 [uncultured Gemmatimonadota bacterium]
MERLSILCLCAPLTAALLHAASANTLEKTPETRVQEIRTDSARRCTASIVSQERLSVTGGHEIYVEPVTLAAVGGDVLLAGSPAFLWDTTKTDDARRQQNRRILGVVIHHDGHNTIVPSPIDAKLILGIRAVGIQNNTWAVVFAESKPWVGSTPPDTADRVWFGVYNGSRWSTLEQIPLPHGVRVHPLRGSGLVRQGDTLFWAVRTTTEARASEVVVFRREGARWFSDTVPTRDATDLALAYSGSLGAVLAVVQPDTSVTEDNGSLYLYARQARWMALRRVVSGEKDATYAPTLRFTRTHGVLSWSALTQTRSRVRRESRAATLDAAAQPQSRFTVDPQILDVSIPVESSGSTHLWITDHAGGDGTRQELRFVAGFDAVTSTVGVLPNPYAGYFGAVSALPGHVIIAGPIIDRTQRRVLSLVIRARVVCGALH